MDHLWTPWRMAYIRGEKKPVQGCVFCNIANGIANANGSDLMIARSKYVFAVLNRYPYNNGHLMIVPYEHIETLEVMSPEGLANLMLMTNRALAVLRKAYNPPAFNLGANLGQIAGAGIAEHFHFHVVPRWQGDASFMTTVGNTRVIPDTIENTTRELQAVWKSLYPDESK
jgi:ATP adenylyltransferase